MRVHICAVGQLKPGPEKLLIDDYLSRLDAAGRPIGISAAPVIEVEEKRKLDAPQLMAREAELLLAATKGATIVAMDERGKNETSEVFARRLGEWRDNATADLAFVIGGANGLDPAIREKAAHIMSFGAMTWPHMLARAMLAEQLYRAVTILSGHPYHRA
ncbi:MAG: 23S rRNA (pseudouridine(1915)-N(3))-methyltransferase RlmH [Alphaproteobacteria bacterium]|nr:23S rRNA (pseudouridine(1915)-N(3))-methyltransferase RlmH [Alphaproteobacteria bacterium]MDX5415093.1 23S rRNA (pseudouridine(1915)-N(3))-methyltransferase RlmH [Alphaproteobacteria bacterium]MDX5492284.1 23S rRNA (pseudouridine(1915)-N(3))-methyltransferase RlmH [Alphaproteobacteria bacterium]